MGSLLGTLYGKNPSSLESFPIQRSFMSYLEMLTLLQKKVDLEPFQGWYFLVAFVDLVQCGSLTSSMTFLSFQSHIISFILSSYAPSKILVFSWKLLQDKFPFSVKLFRRWVLSDPSRISCPFYGFLVEIVSHLFITCEIILLVWYRVFIWLA